MFLSLGFVTLLSLILQILYTICVFGLTLYGGQALWLTWQLCRRSSPQKSSIAPQAQHWPQVTIHLPVYNEQHVVGRLISACAQLDYPHERLQIRVLDDSTDETTVLTERWAGHWRRQGLDVAVCRRHQRQGYKAGALADALPQASGEFIAIFDADFVPPPDFLRRMIPHLLLPQNERVGFVQARWGHLNAGYSALTRCQALALDGHFVVEQAARQQSDYPFGFNGSAGVWRRACIEDIHVGGWQTDTLCEDLDLSYRAQLAGWMPLYLDDLVVPAEIPPQLLAFKRQQFRWAKGSVQVLKKLARSVWRSEWSVASKVAASLHLGNYLIHPLLLLLLLLVLPLLLLGVDPFWPLTYFSFASMGPPLLYAVAQRRLHPQAWLRRWAYLPLLTLLGTGLCCSNSRAVWQALRSHDTPFLRTPKFEVQRAGDCWQRSAYVLGLDRVVLAELLLCLYACVTAGVAAYQGNWWTVPFLLIYAVGFGAMVGIGGVQVLVARFGVGCLNGKDFKRWLFHHLQARVKTRKRRAAGFNAVDFVKSRGR